MGDMAEYYDDRDSDIYNPKDDRWYPRGHPSAPKPRRRNGWNQVNTPSKGKPVALTGKQKLRKLESELEANLSLQRRLREEAADLRNDIKKVDVPDEPPVNAGNMFLVEIQYTGGTNATMYEYLLMRCGKRWYTTGVKDEHKIFNSWLELCTWLNSTYWHGGLSTLGVVEARRWPTEYTEEVPF